MNEIITKLYEIDEQACEIFEQAKLEKKRMEEQLDDDFLQLSAQYEEELNGKLKKHNVELEQKAARQMEEMKTSSQKQIEDLEDIRRNHLDEVAQKILLRIIEV